MYKLFPVQLGERRVVQVVSSSVRGEKSFTSCLDSVQLGERRVVHGFFWRGGGGGGSVRGEKSCASCFLFSKRREELYML